MLKNKIKVLIKGTVVIVLVIWLCKSYLVKPKEEKKKVESVPIQYNFEKMIDSRKTLISPLISCEKSKHKKNLLVIAVATATKNKLQRATIRDTWGADAANHSLEGDTQIAVLFFIGKPRRSEEFYLLADEIRIHKDIVQFDFLDTYHNLTLKTVSMFHWTLQACPEAKYIFKTDDDVFLNVPKLIEEYTSSNDADKYILAGQAIYNSKPYRNPRNKWYVSRKEYPLDTYPDYLSGCGYLVSRAAAQKILKACKTMNLLQIEDLWFTGLCRIKAGLGFDSNPRFVHFSHNNTECYYDRMLHLSPIRHHILKRVWKKLQDVRDGAKKC